MAPPDRLAERHAKKEAQRKEAERLKKEKKSKGKAKPGKGQPGAPFSKAKQLESRKNRRAALQEVRISQSSTTRNQAECIGFNA